MRFSLGTLILVVLWLGSLAMVWVQREPWVKIIPPPPRSSEDPPAPGSISVLPFTSISPDESRRFEIRHVDGQLDCVVIVDNPPAARDAVIWEMDGNFDEAGFVNNDVARISDYHWIREYRRRFPEWWWGHLYRPEMWIAIVLSAALVWRIAKKLRALFTKSVPVIVEK